MLVVGTAMLDAPAERVWAALRDPAALCRAIPGCGRFEIIGPGAGQFTTKPGLPAVAGVYSCTVSVTDEQKPGLIAVSVSAGGERGTVAADLTLRLAPVDGAGTLVSYEADGVAAGGLAGVGTKLLASAAKRLAAEFFSAVSEVIAERGKPEATTAPTPQVRLAPADRVRPPTADQSRPAALADTRAAVLAGTAIGLAGVIAGVLLGRRNRPQGRNRS
jgi:uncharacterized protein